MPCLVQTEALFGGHRCFLDALASLVLMIDTDTLTDSQIGNSILRSHSNVTQSGMSLKMECHSKWNVT